jgi:circadian clock protein KaiB
MAKPKNGNGKSASKRSSKSKLRDATEAFEEALTEKALRRVKYILRLYVTGSSRRSLIAVYNLKKICEEYFPDEYDLEVIDIYKDPGAVREEQNHRCADAGKKTAACRSEEFVGDMSNTQKILVGLMFYKRHDNQEGKTGARS